MPYPTDSVIFAAENITENSTVFPHYREIPPFFYHFLDDKFAFVLNSIYLRTVSIMCRKKWLGKRMTRKQSEAILFLSPLS